MEPHHSHSLSRAERLRSRGAIRRLFEEGKSGFVYPLRYMWFAEDTAENQSVTECEVLFTVPKRFHKRANKRNLLRRRVKESYRLQKSILVDAGCPARNIDLALVYSTKEAHTYKTVNNAVRKILENIAKDL
ncbi:MAG: ribonuclease P protein component [Rikenellaceae bacterium]